MNNQHTYPITGQREKEIAGFFNRYSQSFNRALKNPESETEQTAGFFATCFVGAGPTGVACGKNDAQFGNVISKGFIFYKNIGISAAEIVATQITLLDAFHAMADVHWKFFYNRKGQDGQIEFNVIYFTQELDGQPKIFAYISCDEQAALKQHGLVG